MTEYEKKFCDWCKGYMPFEVRFGTKGICCMCRWETKPTVKGKYKKRFTKESFK